MVLSDCYSWDNEQFGHARLGDPRRTRRLVSLASSLAQHAGRDRFRCHFAPSEFELAAVVPDKDLDKYDEYLPESLLAKG